MNNSSAARKSFIMNRVGDMGFILAILWMLSSFGTVSYHELYNSENGLMTLMSTLNNTDLVAISLLLFVGASAKSAQIPLYTWLPDAMAGPTPVSALIHAATMVTAGIYMIARSNILYSLSPITMSVVAIIGVATALLAAIIALRQNDIKKVLAYSTVSQLGYMFLGLGVGAYGAAVFHVMTHAFFKGLLFLAAGSVIHALSGEQDIRKMGGLSKKMKITFVTFFIACIAIAGIPPFSGFFSKDEILSAAFASDPLLWILGLIGSLLTAFYMFRLLSLTFSGKFRGTEEQAHHVHESPSTMTVPLIILAILAAVGGLIGIPEVFVKNGDKLGEFLSPVFARSAQILPVHHAEAQTEIMLMAITSILAIIIAIWAYKKYKNPVFTSSKNALARAIDNKFYVDEAYDMIFVKPYYAIAKFLNNVVDKKGIDGIVNGVGRGVQYSSRQFRLLQSGQVGSYLLLMVIGMLLLFIIQLFTK
jgi:NADH-quinone oxidoreductase subunit L